MNIEDILAEVRYNGRLAVDKHGNKFKFDELKNRSLLDINSRAPWSLAPITKEITLEQLERALRVAESAKGISTFEVLKDELGF